MDLKTFVSETLFQIAAGVADVKGRFEIEGVEAEVNPATRETQNSAFPSPVEFDVAVTVTDESGDGSSETIGGKVGVLSVLSLQASAQAAQDRSKGRREENVSRVRFTVQLAQPGHITRPKPVRIPDARTRGGY